jgi:hypothetical protein
MVVVVAIERFSGGHAPWRKWVHVTRYLILKKLWVVYPWFIIEKVVGLNDKEIDDRSHDEASKRIAVV